MSSLEYAIIAAAGLGSRLGHGIPKCLVEIGGRAIIERQLEALSAIPYVRIVVGYMEHAVMDVVSRIRKDVIFVRNPSFRSTTTQDSYAMAAKGLNCQCLFLDADIVFDSESLNEFIMFSESYPVTVGVTAAKTDNAVYAVTHLAVGADLEIVSFSPEPCQYEWANVVSAPAGCFFQKRGAVFETLQTLLPVPAKEIISFEVDTEQDLRRAEKFVNPEM